MEIGASELPPMIANGDNMVERLALAMVRVPHSAEDDRISVIDGDTTYTFSARYLAMARAALEAMREPTEAINS